MVDYYCGKYLSLLFRRWTRLACDKAKLSKDDRSPPADAAHGRAPPQSFQGVEEPTIEDVDKLAQKQTNPKKLKQATETTALPHVEAEIAGQLILVDTLVAVIIVVRCLSQSGVFPTATSTKFNP
jgi:hypothetical protein